MPKVILESAIYQEAAVIKSDPKKAIFKMTMQTADEVNQNKRLYPKVVLNDAMTNHKDKITRRQFVSEMDHPVPMGNEAFDGVRQTTVLLKEVSHLLRTYEWRNNHLIGELETTSTPNGNILLGLLRDKIAIGLSMRGLAELERRSDGTNEVKAPLYIIAFDAVSLPSHKSAMVDFNEMKFESKDLIREECGVICSNGVCYLPDYFDKLVESKVIKFFDKWI